MKKPTKLRTVNPTDAKPDPAKEERKAKARARRIEFENAVKTLQANANVWQPFVALHDAIKALQSPEERKLAATTLSRLLRRPAGAKRAERLRARLAKIEEQRQKLQRELATGVA